MSMNMSIRVCVCTSKPAIEFLPSSNPGLLCLLHARPQVKEESSEGEEVDKVNNNNKMEKKKKKEFSGLDYSAPTPSWAIYGSLEAGFNPSETR